MPRVSPRWGSRSSMSLIFNEPYTVSLAAMAASSMLSLPALWAIPKSSLSFGRRPTLTEAVPA